MPGMTGNLRGFDARHYPPDSPTLAIPPEHAFADELQAAGYQLDGPIQPQAIQRLRMADKPRGQRTGWYWFSGVDTQTGIAVGVYGDWRREDERHYWCNKSERELSPQERMAYDRHAQQMREQAEQEREANRARVAEEAQTLIDGLPLASRHDYLTRKQVRAYSLYQDGDALVMPLRDVAGKIHSVQRIWPNGDKRFLAGGRTKGCFHLIGSALTEPTYLVEGYATGATVHQITGKAVVVAMNAGNLKHVLQALREAGNQHQVIIAADNDRHTDGNPGIKAAEEAASGFVGVSVAAPDFQGTEGTDFNDLAVAEGESAVRAALTGQQDSGPRIQLTRVTDLDMFKPLDYLIDDFLVQGTTSLIWGPPGCGKSFVAIDMGLHIATGEPWHGHEVSQGPVIYVCGEGFNGIPIRVAAWQKAHGHTGSIEFYMTQQAVPIAAPGVADELLASIRAIHAAPAMVQIDTLNRNFGAGSENEQEDMDLYLNASHKICEELGCSVMTVHHAGKNTEHGPRGSTTLPGAVYTNMEMKREGESYTLITHKQKDGPEARPVRMSMLPIDLGEAEDHRGRMRPVGSLVIEVEADTTIGENAAANFVGKQRRKRIGKNQWQFLAACRAQAGNADTVDSKQLRQSMRSVGFADNRISELFSWAEEEGILAPKTDKNRAIFVFREPR